MKATLPKNIKIVPFRGYDIVVATLDTGYKFRIYQKDDWKKNWADYIVTLKESVPSAGQALYEAKNAINRQLSGKYNFGEYGEDTPGDYQADTWGQDAPITFTKNPPIKNSNRNIALLVLAASIVFIGINIAKK
jgi:hypothetical protein